MSIQKEHIGHYFMFSCRIKDRNNFVFVLEEPMEMPDPFELREFRVLQYQGDNVQDPNNWASRRIGKDTKLFHDWVTKPSQNWLFTTYWGSVLHTGENVMNKEDFDYGLEEDIPPYPGMSTTVLSTAKVIGGRMYMVSSHREARRRDGPDTWTILNNGLPELSTIKDATHVGFEDIDGFSETDIYAAGRRGDVWHWNGHRWEKVPMPTNADIYGVCCGGDGLVYMSTGVETFVVGRENRWEIIRYGDNKDLYDVKFRNMVWFKDRVYMGYGSTLYEIKDKQFKPSRLNHLEGKPVDWSCLDANDEILLAGSKLEVAVFDGERFETVIPFEVGGR